MRREDQQQTQEEEILRTRKPQQGEILAIVVQMLGSDKLRVDCDDGKERIARIPGKLRKKIWIRVGDLILVQPWKEMPDQRADVVWRYTNTQASWLQKNNYLKRLKIA
ncbi:MAG: translation initiation factor eIF-1A [Candidatus Aenigmatarchaeota archaeon]|nr:translation initiation factor eIF-1A [Candidatus Aenigmarchaeota archaeon]